MTEQEVTVPEERAAGVDKIVLRKGQPGRRRRGGAIVIPANARRFRSRPVNALVALFPSPAPVATACETLLAAEYALDGVHVLAGMEGSRIADRYWTRRGIRRGRLNLQSVDYFEVVLSLYGSGLRGHGALLVVPCKLGQTLRVARLLGNNGAHTITYFGERDLVKLGG